MKEIIIPVLFYLDEEGNKVFDYEGMQSAFELTLSELV